MKKVLFLFLICSLVPSCKKEQPSSGHESSKQESPAPAPEAANAAPSEDKGASEGGAAAPVASRPAVKEVEPNNRQNEATSLEIGQNGEGFINGPEDKGDVDFWRFTLEEAAQVTISLSGLPTLDVAFSLHGSQDDEAIVKAYSNSDGEKEKLASLGEVYPAIKLNAGTYFVKVYQFKKNSKEKNISDAENSYTLTITKEEPSDTMENEPNDRQSGAAELTLGSARMGYLPVKNDADWYKVMLPEDAAGKGLKLSVTIPKKVKPALRITSDIGEVLKEVGAMKDEGEVITIPVFVIKENRGPLFVELNSRWTFNNSEPYQIMAELVNLDVAFEEESNDRPVEATTISSSMFIRGHIDQGKILDKAPWRKADEDWFKIALPEEQAVMVTLSGLEEVDLVLSLYNADGSEKWLSVNDNGKKEGEIIAPVLLKEALFLVSAKNKNQFNAESPYELQIRPFEGSGKLEREPNNKKEQATILAVGAEGLNGWLHPKEDSDVYKIDQTDGSAGNFELKVTGIPVVPLKVSVVDSEGNEIAAKEQSMDKDPVKLALSLEKKVYYAIVTHGGKKALSNPRDPYTISLTAAGARQ